VTTVEIYEPIAPEPGGGGGGAFDVWLALALLSLLILSRNPTD